MIIDFHLHTAIYDPPTQSLDDLIKVQWGNQSQSMRDEYGDPKAVLKLMDKVGIDYAVILAELAPITTGIASNEYVEKFCAESERLIPFASINPYTQVRSDEYLDQLVNLRGFRGLKLYPTYQYYYMNDPMMYPF